MNAIDPPATAQARALAARYGTEPTSRQLPWNDVIASLLNHRSVRGYVSDPVPPGTLEVLVAAAQSAATSSNLQTWSVMEVTDPAKRKVLAEIASGQQHIVECPLFLVFIADLSRNERLGKAEGTTLEVLPYLGEGERDVVAAVARTGHAGKPQVPQLTVGGDSLELGRMLERERLEADSRAFQGDGGKLNHGRLLTRERAR
jgi:hypothetical protein